MSTIPSYSTENGWRDRSGQVVAAFSNPFLNSRPFPEKAPLKGSVMSLQIVKRTKLPNGTAVVTIERTQYAHLVRPFGTFPVVSSSKYAHHINSFATQNVALHAHWADGAQSVGERT
jgi:hypothetical protein